jgi:UDP-hydrolysing UDP-N-acetyl-D-glucosamine 2-epimerase
MRTIALVTSSRADWGIQRPVAEALRARSDVRLAIVACGMHLSRTCGYTVEHIRADGFDVAHEVDFLQNDDSSAAAARAMGEGVKRFADLFSAHPPELITVLGDRFDMIPAALAATPLGIPLAHLHGGELTYGAFDDALRHAITKLAHIHLASTEEYAQRIRQMGEDPRQVHVVGAPGLDDLLRLEPLEPAVLAREYGFRSGATNVLVVYHPETLASGAPPGGGELFAALAELDDPILIVRPNADPGNAAIHREIDAFCDRQPHARAAVSLNRRAFLSLMRAASVMVGNSSSGIIEAPSFGLPVVNIGERQGGRVRAANVIDCAAEQAAITTAIRTAVEPYFRDQLTGLQNPYGDGHSGTRIAQILATTELGAGLLQKRFVDAQSMD